MLVNDFVRFVQPDVHGCPEFQVERAIVNAVIDFCSRSHAWRELQAPVALVDGQADYVVDTPPKARVLLVTDVYGPSRPLDPLTPGQLQRALPDWRTATGTEPAYFNSPERGLIRVYPTPLNAVAGAEIQVRAALAPTIDATTLPSDLVETYHEALASGAKARLMLQPSVAWSNPQLGAYHQQLFLEAAVSARIEAIHEGVQGVITVAPRRFG